jgi:LemA protein
MEFFKKKSNVIAVSVIGVLFISMMWFFSVRNNLVMMDEDVSGTWAQVENQLQRRYDLIPNLVNTVKGIAAHEKDVFTAIAEARSRLGGAQTQSQKIQGSQMMESALSRLLVVVERYPDLKANQNFSRLMDELAGSENRLSVERRRFNESVKRFNKAIRLFPKSFVASASGFEKKDYFQVSNSARENPKVSF